MTWTAFEAGATLGRQGSENGEILRDEEHSEGARITLERGSHAPYAITCGIYGSVAHTAFAASESEASTKYETMKQRLVELINEQDEERYLDGVRDFVDRF